MVRIDFRYLDHPYQKNALRFAHVKNVCLLMNLTIVWGLHARSDDVVSGFSGNYNCKFG